jgi:hypothetical protein
LQAVCGDEGSDSRTVQGHTAGWYKVLVEECVSSLISYPGLSFEVSLTSPSGMDYDLYVYEGDDSGTDCADIPAKATGTPESYGDSWGDTPTVDDGVWYTFEIRHLSGSDCSVDWTLTVDGNT